MTAARMASGSRWRSENSGILCATISRECRAFSRIPTWAQTPTHTTKLGVRYRYYICHALLQKRRDRAGDITRLPAPEIEALVVNAVRQHLECREDKVPNPIASDRELIERYVERVTIRREAIEVRVALTRAEPTATTASPGEDNAEIGAVHPVTITLPWTAPAFAAVTGIVHAPAARPAMTPEAQEAFLTAIAKARGWINDLVEGRVASFAEIASREGKVERHIRLLAPLALVSPRIISAVMAADLQVCLTVTGVANGLPHDWTKQERRIGLDSTREI
jgi:site-specific DNA recombinase